MAKKYGFSGVNKTVNNSRFNSSNFDDFNYLNSVSISAGRVVNIITESDNPKLIGNIEYVAVEFNPGDVSTNPPKNGTLVAKPLFTNVKNFPLINELVLIIRQPNINIKSSTSSKSTYYLNVLNLWSHPHHNALPFAQGKLQPTQNKTLSQITAGSNIITTDQLTNITFGKTFIERNTINPLKSFEGDIIYEGRWGNTIRFGSTIKTINNNIPLNNWSEGESTSGDPILILRNGQGEETKNSSEFIVENINKDDSSIYLTSTQKIPLQASSTNYFSYPSNPPQDPNQYQGKQIIINSGRLIFNTTEDHLLLSSAQSISLSSKSGVNIDTSKFIVQTQNIYLGSKNAKEPLLLGNQTVELLNLLITNLSSFMTVCSTLATSTGTPLVPLNIAAIQINESLQALQANLESLKSKYNYTV